jgi:hypothetical protein
LSPDERAAIVVALSEAFGPATDVSPDPEQPLHVALAALALPAPWTRLTKALLRFAGWPDTRPDFFIAANVVNAAGEAPRSHTDEIVLGASWRRFSYTFPWDPANADPVRAVQLWLGRFREAT